MKSIRRHFNGTVVVLDEPAPVVSEAEVHVVFLNEAQVGRIGENPLRRYWENARSIYLQFAPTGSELVLRDRGHFQVTASGLPDPMPTDEEWQERATRVSATLRKWQHEAPSEDLATLEELKAGLEANPVRFQERNFDDWPHEEDAGEEDEVVEMLEVVGRYNGSVVVFDEPPPVDHEVEVVVRFPEPLAQAAEGTSHPLEWYWDQSQKLLDGSQGSISEEVARQRAEL
jgi:hypothetical protein